MWTTYHRDPGRSGDDPDATRPIPPVLAWQTENLGAPIWGQPLVLGSHVYVATVGDELYELNASTGAVEWQQSAGTPVPSNELPCGDITPTVGIVSTPVIDTGTGAIYAVADTWNAGAKEAKHLLEGFDLQTGERVLSTPVDPPGADAKTLLQRSALNLDEGDVVFGFGGNFGSCSEELAPVVAAPALGGPARFWQTHGISAPTTAGGVWATSGAAVGARGQHLCGDGQPAAARRRTDHDRQLRLLRQRHQAVARRLRRASPGRTAGAAGLVRAAGLGILEQRTISTWARPGPSCCPAGCSFRPASAAAGT